MNRAPSLTPQQLWTLRTELLADRARLERLMAMDAKREASEAHENVSVATQVGLGAATLTQARTHARYDAIVRALERLSTAEYGTCTTCNRPIPYGRLIVMPEVTRCVTCGPGS